MFNLFKINEKEKRSQNYDTFSLNHLILNLRSDDCEMRMTETTYLGSNNPSRSLVISHDNWKKINTKTLEKIVLLLKIMQGCNTLYRRPYKRRKNMNSVILFFC